MALINFVLSFPYCKAFGLRVMNGFDNNNLLPLYVLCVMIFEYILFHMKMVKCEPYFSMKFIIDGNCAKLSWFSTALKILQFTKIILWNQNDIKQFSRFLLNIPSITIWFHSIESVFVQNTNLLPPTQCICLAIKTPMMWYWMKKFIDKFPGAQ